MEAMQKVDDMITMFNTRMEAFQKELQKVSAVTVPSVASLASEFDMFRTFMVTATRTLQQEVQLVARDCDRLEMYNRRRILLLHGIEEENKEDAYAVVLKVLFRDKMPPIPKEELCHCHRMGRPRDGDKPRPILLEFRDLQLRNKVWASKTCLKGSGVTVSEFLTKPRHEAFLVARKRFGVSKCWTRDGYILVLDETGTRHRVSTIADLTNIPEPPTTHSPSKCDRQAERQGPTTRRAKRQ